MSEGHEPIRSYQRIFRPERRIYHLEGRALPVPGGVPLRWLAYATGALIAVLALASGSDAVTLLIAAGGAVGGFMVGGRAGAALAGIVTFAAAWFVGVALGLLDWPLRLVVVPFAFATFATQATPDGRHADRFAVSWLALRLAPRRRSLGRGVAPAGLALHRGGELWVGPDQHSPVLRRARIRGAGILGFAHPVGVRRVGVRQRRLLARPAESRRRHGDLSTARLALGRGEIVEVRP